MFWVPLVVAGMDQARMSHQRACVEVSGLQANWVKIRECMSWVRGKTEQSEGS